MSIDFQSYSERLRAVRRMEFKLRRESFPRLQMFLLVFLTGGFGFLASFFLLRLGLESMAIRYPIALACAYIVFLALIWLWLRTKASDYLDAPDLSVLHQKTDSLPNGEAIFKAGGGGDFAGGGASGSWETPVYETLEVPHTPIKTVADVVANVGDADEITVPLFVVALLAVAALGLVIASAYVVYIAPLLLAEVLVDGTLSYVLFKNLSSNKRPNWVLSTLRHTLIPFVLTAIFLAGAGYGIGLYAPHASSVGQLF